MFHWNLGNTTIRNPNRIKEGLRIFKKNFEGKPFTEREQLEFYKELLKAGILESRGASDRSKEITGRKWAACFNQLGFTIAWKSRDVVRITDAGNALLSDDIPEEEVFLKQFLKYRLPTPIEKGKEYAGFDVNPLYVILRLLNDLAEENEPGLHKEEISLFVITCLRNDDIKSCKDMILDYRNHRKTIKGMVAKKNFYYQRKKELIERLYAY
ncbi:MAG: AlwI family type II restriction endonuclease, partial [Candidatus Thorarchaeota archaeon]